ncbi:MAG: hypothetical protein M3081_00350 [Gemmatimonadota bacterium]|nr:hypothetical protein [Gemmatimonadota bacterium]
MTLRFLLLVLALTALALRAGAQSSLRSEAELLVAPDGRAIALLRPGTQVKTGASRGGFTQVTVGGFINATAVGGKRDTFAISVAAPSGALLRSAAKADAAPLGKLNDGMGLVRDAKTGDWFQVHRSGWIASRLLQTAAASAPARPVAAAPAIRPATTPANRPVTTPAPPAVAQTPPPQDTTRAPLPNEMSPVRRTLLGNFPNGKTVGTLEPGSRIEPLVRERGWVKVHVEGWVREADLVAVDSSINGTVSAADLRAAPDAWRGKTVRWEVQVIAFQIADALRKELALDEPYLLARGPGADNSLLYLAVPPTMLAAAKAASSPAMQRYVITARVRTGKSDPAGVPILDILTLTRR